MYDLRYLNVSAASPKDASIPSRLTTPPSLASAQQLIILQVHMHACVSFMAAEQDWLG